jgi:hypothetical protein
MARVRDAGCYADLMVVQIGAHTIVIEGDMLITCLRGDFTAEETVAYLRLVEQVLAEHGRFFMLVDMNRADTIPPETRRISAEFGRKHPPTGMAVWGSNVAVRVLLTLILRTISFFQKDAVPIAFVASEHEARAWVAAQRSLRAPSK